MSNIITPQLLDRACRLHRRLKATSHNGPYLQGLGELLLAVQGRELSLDECANQYCEALACCLLTVHLSEHRWANTSGIDWLVGQSRPPFKRLLEACCLPDKASSTSLHCDENRVILDWSEEFDGFAHGARRSEESLHFYECFLQVNDPSRRARRGAYYTPNSLVSFIVRSVDEILRRQFGLADGLADTTTWGEMARKHRDISIPEGAEGNEPFVRILDPATGSGAFLVEIVEVIHRTMIEKWRRSSLHASAIQQHWNDYVTRSLLPRIFGLELMLAPCAIAQIHFMAKLAETGYHFDTDQKAQIFCADTLAAPSHVQRHIVKASSEVALTMTAAESIRYQTPFTVILGNPPFCAASSNRNQWIDNLLRGKTSDHCRVASYYELDGRSLGERKLWLQDDYVKFIRFAQWKIEQSGCGVLGYVTNHGYLDNITFRGMRQALSRDFPHITVIDLHGNHKKKETPPNGGVDQSVFEIEQGVAVGLMSRGVDRSSPAVVSYSELWGKREEKLQRLQSTTAGQLPATLFQPTSPAYFFVPQNETLRDEYERGFKLTEIMPVNSTAAVTARDSFVVAMEQEPLLHRMREFRDLSIADEIIRGRYFNNSRSHKYSPGDTRGWKLGGARKKMASDQTWRQNITTCLYRPFDRRWIYWANWMVDWPRSDVSQHLISGDNLALVARRQMPPTQPCNYFWITDQIVLDGVIRSDNRGSESFFPLYLYDGKRNGRDHQTPAARANFDIGFIRAVEQTYSLAWLDMGQGDLRLTLGPLDLLHYIYALFHSPSYRERYADYLRTDFPRVFLADSQDLFRSLCRQGEQLLSLHLLRDDGQSASVPSAIMQGDTSTTVARGYPKFSQGRVFINKGAWFANVPASAWNYRVGAYQVCRKWLKDRRGKPLSSREISTYSQMVAALSKTIAISAEIDASIEQRGGWPAAFSGSMTFASSGQCSTSVDRCEAVTAHC